MKILVQKRTQNLLPEIPSRIAVKLQSTQCAAVRDLLAVIPRPDHQEDLVVAGVLGFDRLIDGRGAVDVLLIPQTVDQHHGHRQWLCGQHLVDCLIAPKRIVTWMLEDLPPETHLFKSPSPSEFTGRSGLHEHVIVVKVAGPPFGFVLARCLLVVDIGHSLLTEGTMMEPIVAQPTIDHGVHRHGHADARDAG